MISNNINHIYANEKDSERTKFKLDYPKNVELVWKVFTQIWNVGFANT